MRGGELCRADVDDFLDVIEGDDVLLGSSHDYQPVDHQGRLPQRELMGIRSVGQG